MSGDGGALGNDEHHLIKPIPTREFELYALSLERGPNFDPAQIFSAYKVGRGSAAGCILFNPDRRVFSTIAMRRRIDFCWVLTDQASLFPSPEMALHHLGIVMRGGDAPELLPSGMRRRRPLMKVGPRGVAKEFKLLSNTISHLPALVAISECYLALPNPDENFVTDLQTSNFSSRLFELYLLACFREQGIVVQQNHVSPDFWIENNGSTCWVEAVTANSGTSGSGGIGDWERAPTDRNERMSGAPAARFARTLRSKLQRNYHEMNHVRGEAFAIAIADFHASGSMVWSREALPTYLYGVRAHVEGEGERRRAVSVPISHLIDEHAIPAGLFRDPNFAHLSAIIFSNAATLAKFNRMGFLAGVKPPRLRMTRMGVIFDRTPGALEPIEFELEVGSNEYASLWPQGEEWCQELEVFHNPMATKPLPFSLIPGATHWFEGDGDIECRTIWKNTVLSSITLLRQNK
ncbi:hypothetical protein [Gluconobacter wancherniae]|uniref:hypothetical protein n=1 Tax=Gluconobacter wancherniae TaxID=1307955 RepID=UPI001B8BF285|nr:hypothetical protein [Gluconobacter wancherniae]MBS1095256.1 hypothetical protein [Gluconobacter wancherniae]